MQRSCNACGREYEAKTPRSKFCGAACRNRAHRNPHLVSVKPQGSVATQQSSVATVTERTAVRIAELDLAEDPHAAVAMVIAGRLDRNEETGAAVASLARQYAVVMEDLARRGKRAADPLDALRARREAKASGA